MRSDFSSKRRGGGVVIIVITYDNSTVQYSTIQYRCNNIRQKDLVLSNNTTIYYELPGIV